MRNVAVIALVVAMAFSSPMLAAPRIAQAQAPASSLAGTATASTGEVLPNVTVQLRNLTTGELSGSTTSNAAGSFAFAGLAAGQYAIELVSATGQIVGASAAIPVAAGATVTGVTVTATTAFVASAGAAAAGAGAAGAGAGVSTAVIVTTVAVAAGIAGAVAVAANASPSQ
jgi:hypothetical protein